MAISKEICIIDKKKGRGRGIRGIMVIINIYYTYVT